MISKTYRRHHSRGFTLVELLVVIAIIGILVALLLPAIQAAREAARRAQCQSHLKNLALACLNYESANKRFPTGFVATSPTMTESWAWSTFILPYLEEQTIYDRLRPSPTFMQPVDGTRTGARNLADLFVAAKSNVKELEPLQAPIPVFRCPSDNTPALIPVPANCTGTGACPAPNDLKTRTSDLETWERQFNGANSPGGFQPSTSNYVGSKGIIDAECPGSGSSPNWVARKDRCDNTGIFYGNSQVSLKQITDGTTKTFLIGERDKFCLAATWIGIRNPLNGAEMWASAWAMAHSSFKLNYPYSGGHNTCTESFSSAHPGGGFFAFCDGSVHFIDDEIDFNLLNNSLTCYASPTSTAGVPCVVQNGSNFIGIYQRLSWRNDGLAIDGGAY